MSDFDPSWPHGHVTRDGRKARVICTDLNNKSRIVAAITQPHCGGFESIAVFDECGQSTQSYRTDDLLNAPAPKKKVWVNVYERDTPFSNSYSDRLKADLAAQRDTGHRIACIEVTEGQGLDGEKV